MQLLSFCLQTKNADKIWVMQLIGIVERTRCMEIGARFLISSILELVWGFIRGKKTGYLFTKILMFILRENIKEISPMIIICVLNVQTGDNENAKCAAYLVPCLVLQ